MTWDSMGMTRITEQEIEKEIIRSRKSQQLFDWLRPRLHGWTPALFSKGPWGVRIQLQSAPETSEETGDIKCITGTSFPNAIMKVMEFCSSHKIRRELNES